MYSGLAEVGEVKYSVGIKTEQCNLKIAERHGDIIITVTLLRGWNLNDITLTLRTFRDLQYGTSIWKKTPRNLRTDLVQSFSFYLFIFFITTAFYKFCGFTMKTYMNSKRKKLLYYC